MPTLHPSSAGLRQLADFLDNCAEEGIDVPPLSFVYFGSYSYPSHEAARTVAAAVSKRLNIPFQLPEDGRQYSDAILKAKFSEVAVDFHFAAAAICEQVEVMQPVKVWKCGGVEVTK